MKNGILLIAGLVVTALYVIFSMQIYELLYYESEFSQAMYEENNSVSFARWYHWLIFLGIAVIFAFALDFIYPNSVFSEYDYEFTTQLLQFSLLNIIVEALLFIIVSYSIRWWSSNCRHTPIPQ